MSLRTRIFIVVSLGVMIILAIGIMLLIQGRNKKIAATPTASNAATTQNQTSAVVPVGTEPTVIPSGTQVKPATTLEAEQNAVRQWARIFVEKYYTYSSDSNFGNIRDVQSMVTKSFWQKISAPMMAHIPVNTFISATIQNTGIIQSNLKDNTASVEIKASRISQQGGKTSTSNVDYIVSFIKIGSDWLINDSVSK